MNETDTTYSRIGGEAVVRVLVDAFYDRVGRSPLLRAMHPDDDTESRTKLFWFLSGWLGGPNLYTQHRGHPMLRARHLPFAIDDAAAIEWLECMYGAIDDAGIDGAEREVLRSRFLQTAAFLRNTAGDPQ